MGRIKDENYYQINGWMTNRLKLKGVSLNVFAIIYGFTQDGETEFKGSLNYMCEFLGVSKPTIIKAINELTEKKFITKEECTIKGVRQNIYRANLDVVKNFDWGSKETLPVGSKETLPNNNNDKDIILKYEFNPPVVSAILEWLEYKKQKKQRYVEKGLNKLLSKLKQDCTINGDNYVIDSIDYSISNNYSGIFPPKQYNTSFVSAKKNIQHKQTVYKIDESGVISL